MPVTEIEDNKALTTLVGKEVGLSDWITIDQSRIDQFAEATDDRQWIHTDKERAASESPYGGTIAHGFLTLSMLSFLMSSAIQFRRKPKLAINYGLNRVRFPSPVRSGSQIRARFLLHDIEEIENGLQMTLQITWTVTVTRRYE